MKTTHVLGPMILQSFDKNLLMERHDRTMLEVNEKIIPLSNKKIRSQDVGKRKEFDNLLKEIQQEYERAKIKKAEYDKKVKEAIEEVPRIPSSGRTCRFKRFPS